jgi:hypothetical protein
MEKRYQVFVSSTYMDLSEERLEVIKALLELDCVPCGMEYFPAASEESWLYIASLIDQCDYYVVIVGGRYGSTTEEGISFTEKEYLYATSKGIPAIAFLHAKPDDLPARKTEQSAQGQKRLLEFITLLRRHLCKDWTTIHELGAVVSRSITQLIKRHPRIGWVRANEAGSPATTQEILDLTKKIRTLEEELQRVRGRQSPDAKDLADGDELIELEIDFDVSAEKKGGNWPRSEVVASHDGTIAVSWNDLFRAAAPRMAPMSTDAGVRAAVNGLFEHRFKPPPRTVGKDQWVSSVRITEGAYNVIKVQFTALGLVTLGKERLETGKFSGIMWRLTQLGETRMHQILAVKTRKGKSPMATKIATSKARSIRTPHE